jgi:hypothetical protein
MQKLKTRLCQTVFDYLLNTPALPNVENLTVLVTINNVQRKCLYMFF